MTNGKACPRCKSWEEQGPINWVIVATISGVVTALFTVFLQRWLWAPSISSQLEKPGVSQPASVGTYR